MAQQRVSAYGWMLPCFQREQSGSFPVDAPHSTWPTKQRRVAVGLKEVALVAVAMASLSLVWMFSSSMSPDPESPGFSRVLQAAQGDGPAQCDSLKYATMTCPTWDPTKPDGGEDVDYRVRWMHGHQHPADCRAANYLIRPLTRRIGFGANMMLTLVSSMYMSMYANRIFLLDPLEPFRYADCETQEWSCYFEPLSNCTMADVAMIQNDTGLGYQTVLLDPEHRIIRPQVVAASISQVSPWIWNQRTGEHPWWKDFFMFPGNDEMVAGAMMYAMRPGLRVKTQVEQVLRDALSPHCDFDPDRTISMPIRGSDKCMGSLHRADGMAGESECFAGLLDKYMQMAEDIRRLDPKVDTIILTSEDDRYLQDRYRFEADGRWRFIVNSGDRAHGTGSINIMEEQQHSRNMSNVFVSFFSSLHLQMRGRYYILNCGSNFHLMLKSLVKHGGCSYSLKPVVYCLNEQYADYKLCPADGHENCMNGKLAEVAVKSQKLGVDIPVDLSSLAALKRRRQNKA